MSEVALDLEKEKSPDTFTGHGFKFSVGLHLTLVLWLIAHWAVATFAPQTEQEKKFLKPKQTIRVDIVDLPSLKMQELNQVDLTQEMSDAKPELKKKEPPPVPVVLPEPDPKAMKLPDKVLPPKPEKKTLNTSQKSRLEELQKSIRAEARRNELMAKFRKEAKGEASDKRPKLGGNILSKGGSIQGSVADESDEYTATVQTHVRKFWNQPAWAVGSNLKAHVLVKLSPTGRVLLKQIVKSSGRREFDASVFEAIEAADPFPAPPELLKRIVLQEGFTCGFPD